MNDLRIMQYSTVSFVSRLKQHIGLEKKHSDLIVFILQENTRSRTAGVTKQKLQWSKLNRSPYSLNLSPGFL